MLISALNTTHPDYCAVELEEFEALYEGGKEWHEHIDKWIPKNAQEPPELWELRKKRACYDNHAGPIVDLIVAWLFSKPPTVDDFDPAWESNVDRRGTPIGPWIRNVVTAALQTRREFVWVNLPARNPDVEITNRADEIAAGLTSPFLVHLCAEEVRDWGEDDYGNLAWILVRQEVANRTEVGGTRQKSYRWLWIDGTKIQRWTYTPDPNGVQFPDNAQAKDEGTIPHNMGRMPVARIELPAGLHVMGKVRDPAVRLTRLSNDLDWALHRGAHSLLVLAVADAAQPPVLGPGHYLLIGQDDKASYAEPGGAVYDALDKRITQAREELYRVVQQMASGISGQATKQASSAASKGMDWQSLQVMLSAYAELVVMLIARVIDIAAVPLNVTTPPVVAGLEGWQEDDLTTILEDYTVAQGVVKSATFKRMLAKELVKRMLPADTDEATQDAITAEIDAADYEEADPYAGGGPLIQPVA